MGKDSPEGRHPPRLALHGCQESRESQAHRGPPGKRKQHSQDVSSGQGRAKVQDSSVPPPLWTTPSSQHLSHNPPCTPTRVHPSCPSPHSVQHAWTTGTNRDHPALPMAPDVIITIGPPPQVTTIPSFTVLFPRFSCPHPEFTPDSTMYPHFNPISTS